MIPRAGAPKMMKGESNNVDIYNRIGNVDFFLFLFTEIIFGKV